MLTKDDLIQNEPERRYKVIRLPHPAGDGQTVEVRVRNFFGAERVAFLNAMYDSKGEPVKFRHDHMGELEVAFCWVDDDGKRCMADEDVNAAWWKRQDAAFIEAFIREVRHHNGFVRSDIEDTAKNLPDDGGTVCSSESVQSSVAPPLEV